MANSQFNDFYRCNRCYGTNRRNRCYRRGEHSPAVAQRHSQHRHLRRTNYTYWRNERFSDLIAYRITQSD